ncbi:hypothetical protein Cgig2_030932 [Carnegiea gigantea]|uniref:Endonuclease/exonuclease/phosphatase domain-containing protein n=1 Tax=Carnegiea gigantea TaxID=171969 RepID=A0A9Q1QL54_9CARY|nr:hypothetical protein Cgig2_030932 [Carnegiea gigantea]
MNGTVMGNAKPASYASNVDPDKGIALELILNVWAHPICLQEEGFSKEGMEDSRKSKCMNSPQKQEDIKFFLQQQLTHMVGFLETKVKEENMTRVIGRVCSNWHWEHNADSINKGRIFVIRKTNQIIHGRAIQLSTNKRYFITFVYGRNLEAQRIPLWSTLVSMSNNLDDSWCVLGDFNSVLHQGERVGGNDVSESEMTHFGDCISNCGLQEFSYIGAFFTWTNKTIRSRIDRALHNTLWCDTFDYTHVFYQLQGLSDHSPISLDFPTCPRPRETLQFCDMWVKDPHFLEIVAQQLAKQSQASKLQALKSLPCKLRGPLGKLNRSKYADIYAQQAKAREHLTQAQTQLQKDPLNADLIQNKNATRWTYVSITHSALSLIKQ